MISTFAIPVAMALSMFSGVALLLLGYKTPLDAKLCPKCEYDLRAHKSAVRCPECGEVPDGYHRDVIRGRKWAVIAGWTLIWGPIVLIVGLTLCVVTPIVRYLTGL